MREDIKNWFINYLCEHEKYRRKEFDITTGDTEDVCVLLRHVDDYQKVEDAHFCETLRDDLRCNGDLVSQIRVHYPGIVNEFIPIIQKFPTTKTTNIYKVKDNRRWRVVKFSTDINALKHDSRGGFIPSHYRDVDIKEYEYDGVRIFCASDCDTPRI